MQNSGHGGPHMTRVMTIFGIFVNPPIPNIEKFQLYEIYLTKMFTFMKMVITGVENWSPDMIPVAFERKFDEQKRWDTSRDL